MEDSAYADDPLQVYVREVSRIPPLLLAEEIKCIEHVRASDQMAEAARTRLVEGNLHHVVSLAERCRNEQVHILDLIEQGNKGLLLAVNSLCGFTDGSFWDYARSFVERALAQASVADSTPT